MGPILGPHPRKSIMSKMVIITKGAINIMAERDYILFLFFDKNSSIFSLGFWKRAPRISERIPALFNMAKMIKRRAQNGHILNVFSESIANIKIVIGKDGMINIPDIKIHKMAMPFHIENFLERITFKIPQPSPFSKAKKTIIIYQKRDSGPWGMRVTDSTAITTIPIMKGRMNRRKGLRFISSGKAIDRPCSVANA